MEFNSAGGFAFGVSVAGEIDAQVGGSVAGEHDPRQEDNMVGNRGSASSL